MSTYVPVPVVLGSIALPADGENIDAMDVNSPLRLKAPLANIAQGLLVQEGVTAVVQIVH